MKKVITIENAFSAAHFYHQTKWTDEENKQNFGKCYSKHGHGHDYKVRVSFLKESFDIQIEKKILQEMSKSLDHKHLNHEIEHFKNKIPTTENIALYILNELVNKQFPSEIETIELYERPDLFTRIDI